MKKALREMLLDMLLLFRGIIRFISKGAIILCILIIIISKLTHTEMEFAVKITFFVFILFFFFVLWGYDKLIILICPEDQYIELPF